MPMTSAETRQWFRDPRISEVVEYTAGFVPNSYRWRCKGLGYRWARHNGRVVRKTFEYSKQRSGGHGSFRVGRDPQGVTVAIQADRRSPLPTVPQLVAYRQWRVSNPDVKQLKSLSRLVSVRADRFPGYRVAVPADNVELCTLVKLILGVDERLTYRRA